MINTTNLGSQGQPKYKFTLISGATTEVCEIAPIGNNGIKIKVHRDMDLGGVFIELLVSSLTFVGNPEKVFLQALWDDKEFLAQCDLRVSYLNASRVYIPFSNDFKLDFDTFNNVTVSKSRNGIRIKLDTTGFLTKFNDRKKVKVDITKLESIGGYTIQSLFHWSAANFKTFLNFPEINVYNNALYDTGLSPSLTASVIVTSFAVPFSQTQSDYEETQNVAISADQPIYDNPFFVESLRDRDIEITNGVIKVKFSAGTASSTITFWIASIDTDGTTLLGTTNLGSASFLSGATKTVNFSKNITLLENQQIVIWGTRTLSSGDYTFSFDGNGMRIRDIDVEIPASTKTAFPIYETAERSLQHILDVQFPLKSDFFGRTDVAKNSTPDYYASQDQERFANVLSGLTIRGLALDDENNSYSISFDDIMQSINSLWNVGLGFEVIDDEPRIVIEQRADFFLDVDGLDLSDRINDVQIQFEALPDLVYAQIDTGYKSFLYEAINGRGEYNTNNQRTSIISGSNKFDNISIIRGDTRGATLLLENPMFGVNATGSTDVKGDKDNFILKSQQNGAEWDVETNENITIVNNTSIFGINSFNLFFTPLRNLLRHGYELAAGLVKEPTEFLRFQTSDKLQTLESNDGVDTITENQDVLVSDLGDPKWKAGQYIIECQFYEADFEALEANLYKLVKLSDTKRGWILNIEYDYNNNKAKLNILPKFE